MLLRLLHNKKGQVVSAEYVMVFFLIASVLTSMTVYVKRALQARIYCAETTMATMVADAAEEPVYFEYEPYYTEVTTDNTQANHTIKRLMVGGNFSKAINETRTSNSTSTVLDPSFADH